MQNQWNFAADPDQCHYYGRQCHSLNHTGVSLLLHLFCLTSSHSAALLLFTSLWDSVTVFIHTKCVLNIYFVLYFHGCRSQLTDDELRQLEEACDMALELNQSKHRIYDYVESRMSFIAPNLSIIVGASTAAKIMGKRGRNMHSLQDYTARSQLLMVFVITVIFGITLTLISCPRPLVSGSPLYSGIAGGLTNLSKMPACNLMLLGAQRRTLSGFSSTSLLPHTGFIYHCDVVQCLPPVSKKINKLHK